MSRWSIPTSKPYSTILRIVLEIKLYLNNEFNTIIICTDMKYHKEYYKDNIDGMQYTYIAVTYLGCQTYLLSQFS